MKKENKFNNIEQELFNIYNKCFSNYQTTIEWFIDLLKPLQAHIIKVYNDSTIIGFSLIHENSIALLCVDINYRNQGYGTILLNKSEEYIKKNGAKKVILGRGSNYIFQGVPMDIDNTAIDFFKKHGYNAEWESANMYISLHAFDRARLDIPILLLDINFKIVTTFNSLNMKKLLDIVKIVDPDWVGIYENCLDPIMLALHNEKIIGFQILSLNGSRFLPNINNGSIGCVGVIPSARNKGIGRQMVAEGVDWLKRNGCTSIELLYVELIDWYQKIGFSITSLQWMGEKEI